MRPLPLLFILALSSWAHASDPAEPTITPTRIESEEAPRIDGDLDDPIWRNASVVDNFIQREPHEGEQASERTEVRILYHEKAIYFGVVCYDSEPEKIQATRMRRDDELENDDTFSVLLDTFHDHRNAYLFRSNALGTKFDALITDEQRQLTKEWDEKWDAAGQINSNGWTLEIAIPFKSLRSASGREQAWGINFERVIRRKKEEVYWTGHSRDYEFWNVSQAGILSALSEEKTGLRLRVKPYGLGGFSQLPEENVAGTRLENDSQFGLEVVKASITPSITADFTVNPDFAQAEVDESRFNLTRFSLFFPEKREFFLERAGIFDFGTPRPQFSRPTEVLVFFSRRVGLEEDVNIPITSGARVTGETGGFQFGFLNVLTREKDDFAGDLSTVFRVKKNLLERSYVGAIFTDQRVRSSDSFNRLAGLDANFVLFDKLTARGYWAKSEEQNAKDDNASYHALLAWDSDRLEANLERLRIDERFDPRLGFVQRQGVVKNRARLVWKPRPKNSRLIRQFRISSEHTWFTSQKGFLESRENDLFFGATFQSGDFIGGSINSKTETLDEDFEVHPEVTIPAGNYRYKDFVLFARTHSGRRVSGTFRATVGGFFGGDILATELGPEIRINRRFSASVNYGLNKASLPQGDFTVNVLNTRLDFNISNRLLTSTTFQYNSADNEMLVNWRLNYIYRPGDDLFIVYNEGRDFSSGLLTGLINRTLLVKFTHSFDF